MNRLNRFVGEVRGGVALFFNLAIDAGDGWWWGSDADLFQVGPFESLEQALADASRDMGEFKVVRWDAAELQQPDRPLPPRGHIVVVDTGSKLWVKTGELPPAGWSSRQ
jgi:hypothetical protein